MSAPIPIMYVGTKPRRQDTVAGTGIWWDAPNAVRMVPGHAAGALLQHPDVWVRADDQAAIQRAKRLHAPPAAAAALAPENLPHVLNLLTPELIALAAAKLGLTLHAPGAPITERPIAPIEPIEPIQPPPEGEPAAQAGEDIPPEDPIDSAPPRVRFTPVEGSTTKLIDVDTGDEIDLSEYAVNDLKVFARVNSLKVNLRASHEELQSAVYAAAIAAPSAEE